MNLSPADLESLVTRSQAGDASAFESIVEAMQDMAVALVADTEGNALELGEHAN